jgi:hypothetical protein
MLRYLEEHVSNHGTRLLNSLTLAVWAYIDAVAREVVTQTPQALVPFSPSIHFRTVIRPVNSISARCSGFPCLNPPGAYQLLFTISSGQELIMIILVLDYVSVMPFFSRSQGHILEEIFSYFLGAAGQMNVLRRENL